MASNITSIIDLGKASDYLLNYLIRLIAGYTNPVYNVAVTSSTIGNMEGSKVAGINSPMYVGTAQFSVNSGYLLASITVPQDEAGDITEILFIAGDVSSGEVVLRIPLEYPINKKSGFSLNLRVRLTMTNS